MAKNTGEHHDDGDGDQDPVAVGIVSLMVNGDGGLFVRSYNSWGSRWRV